MPVTGLLFWCGVESVLSAGAILVGGVWALFTGVYLSCLLMCALSYLRFYRFIMLLCYSAVYYLFFYYVGFNAFGVISVTFTFFSGRVQGRGGLHGVATAGG